MRTSQPGYKISFPHEMNLHQISKIPTLRVINYTRNGVDIEQGAGLPRGVGVAKIAQRRYCTSNPVIRIIREMYHNIIQAFLDIALERKN